MSALSKVQYVSSIDGTRADQYVRGVGARFGCAGHGMRAVGWVAGSVGGVIGSSR
jgi:tetrahydromethanopterin S-methyltransferase subunit D